MTDTATETKVPGTGSEGQTFLVGEHVYLRSFEPGDEKNATSWRASIFPKSPELVEKWIKEELPDEGEKRRSHLAIVRKSDDVLVGSIRMYHQDVNVHMVPYVDVLYGEPGQRWLAEAIKLVATWKVDECFVPTMGVVLPANRHVTVNALLADGFVQTARWREMIEEHGERIDKLSLAYFSASWVNRLGHPMDAEMPRSGNGSVRPVPASVTLEGDPPKQSVMVGKRVYLRPEDKKDARIQAEAALQETETFFDIGRHLYTEAQWAEFLSSTAGEEYPWKLFFAVCLRETDEVIGAVGLLDIDYVNRVAETGSVFYNPEYRGLGYGSEAKHLLLEYTFDVLGFHMVTSFVYFPNTRSAAALRKQGYTEAGRACWLYPYEGGFGNMVTFDLLADEWRALPREV